MKAGGALMVTYVQVHYDIMKVIIDFFSLICSVKERKEKVYILCFNVILLLLFFSLNHAIALKI